ncbi:hypothetical protein GCM10009837_07250 [Streptomyces durmitorensis]|uniref:Uncharacterized protein n=1 Tax=Streptomyces durmitorensis TaxID=319947 RepID=A0ABY4PLW2_9ACTN|nr:hypothetical protein [Streptomyces durmitorensis]UQT54382.1 hypothetical protein M4V62_04365 [Streptomyces durmitorensis]
MSDSLESFNDRLDAALAPAVQGASDRLMAQRMTHAAKTGGVEAAKEVAKEMTPEQAARVERHLKS